MATKRKAKPKKAGRKSEFTNRKCELAARAYENGATDFEVANILDIHVSTLYRWMHEFPPFREAAKVGKEVADERVTRSLYHRAVGYTFRSVKIMQDKGSPVIVPFDEHVPPDVGAINQWLTNRQPDKWKSKQSLEHSGPDGAPLKIELEFVASNPG